MYGQRRSHVRFYFELENNPISVTVKTSRDLVGPSEPLDHSLDNSYRHSPMASLRSSFELGVNAASFELGVNAVVAAYRGHEVEIRVRIEVKVRVSLGSIPCLSLRKS